jgi:hypothetical protein
MSAVREGAAGSDAGAGGGGGGWLGGCVLRGSGGPVGETVKPHFVQKRIPSGRSSPQWMQTTTPGQNYMPYITVRSLVTFPLVALVTEDPLLYHEMATGLKDRRIPTISLRPGDELPEGTAVVVTSPSEASAIAHPHVVVVRDETDRRALWAAIVEPPASENRAHRIVVGIDPGPRPGYAVVSGRRCIAQGILDTPEAAIGLVRGFDSEFPQRSIVFRVGTGDPISRNRLINGLLAEGAEVELSDEEGTTPRGHRRPRDAEAAKRIALNPGRGVRSQLPLRVTPGEVANLQRLSREGSEGRITISREDARRVLEGKWSLAEAVMAKLPSGGGHRVSGIRGRPHELL